MKFVSHSLFLRSGFCFEGKRDLQYFPRHKFAFFRQANIKYEKKVMTCLAIAGDIIYILIRNS